VSQGIGVEDDGAAGANVESCLVNFFEPQHGQATAPSHLLDGTSSSKSFSHLLQ